MLTIPISSNCNICNHLQPLILKFLLSSVQKPQRGPQLQHDGFRLLPSCKKNQSWKNFLFACLCFLLIYHNRHIFLCKSFVGKKTANTKTETSIRSSLVTSKDKLPIKSLKDQRRVAKSKRQLLKTTNILAFW